MSAVDQHKMSAAELALLDAAIGDEPLELLLCTGTRADTGGWLRRSPVWLGVTGRQIVLIAAARRQHVERLPLADVRDSWYCHVTGQLVIEPADRLTFGRLNLPPTDALDVLERIAASEQAGKGAPTLPTEKQHAH
jgi:hypothetical protein